MARVKNLSADRRRAVTVEAFLKLAAERNPSDITTAAIALDMGVTQGALFRHFPSKSAILNAVMEWVADQLLARVEKAVLSASSPVDAIEAVFLAHVDFVAEHPGVPRMMFGELQSATQTIPKHTARTMLQRYAEHVQALLEQGMADGKLSPDLDAEAAVMLLIGMVQGLVMQSLIAGDVARMRSDAPRVFSIYRRGIGSTK